MVCDELLTYVDASRSADGEIPDLEVIEKTDCELEQATADVKRHKGEHADARPAA
ncbi:MAG: hypothetical protein Alpg2KO_22910 [Alphaproteobacteria bacterium]